MSTVIESLSGLIFQEPDIERMKAVRDVQGLLNTLGYRYDVALRRRAAFILGHIRDPWAVNGLIHHLKDDDAEVRVGAAWSLGLIGDTRAIEPLIQAMKDTDCEVRALVAEALGRIGDPRAIEPLTSALEDEDKTARCFIEEALARLEQKQRTSSTSGDETKDQVQEASATNGKRKNKARHQESTIIVEEDEIPTQC